MAEFPCKLTAVYFCCVSLKYCHRDSHFDSVFFIIPFTLFLLFLFFISYFILCFFKNSSNKPPILLELSSVFWFRRAPAIARSCFKSPICHLKKGQAIFYKSAIFETSTLLLSLPTRYAKCTE